MRAKALLATHDLALQRVMQIAVEATGADVQLCMGAAETRRALSRTRYDFLVLDCDEKYGAPEILPEARQGCLNRHCTVLAVTSGISTVKETYEMGANFVLDKPVTPEHAARAVRAALECIVREQRRSFRHPVEGSAQLSFGNLLDLRVELCNLSEGGAAVLSTLPLYQGWGVEMKMELPGRKTPIEASGYVAWANSTGLAGIKFMVLSERAKQDLDVWLDSQIAQMDLPEEFIMRTPTLEASPVKIQQQASPKS